MKRTNTERFQPVRAKAAAGHVHRCVVGVRKRTIIDGIVGNRERARKASKIDVAGERGAAGQGGKGRTRSEIDLAAVDRLAGKQQLVIAVVEIDVAGDRAGVG